MLIATTAFGIYFATRFEISEQLRLLAWALGITVFLSFLFGVFFRQYGIESTVHAGIGKESSRKRIASPGSWCFPASSSCSSARDSIAPCVGSVFPVRSASSYFRGH